MNNLIQGFSKAIGQGFAQGIGLGIVYVVLIMVAVFAALAVFGLLFFILAIIFYKKRKPKLFLLFGIISSFCASLAISLILSSKIADNLSLFVILAPFLFIVSLFYCLKKYRNIK